MEQQHLQMEHPNNLLEHQLEPQEALHLEHLQMANPNQQQQQQLDAFPPMGQNNGQFEQFKVFLSTAPVNWNPNESIRRFSLPNGDSVSCILWNELFHITGTDIVRALAYRFQCLGRTITMQKKFEEGIFSDLRNLKPMTDSTLEESRSPFLKFLYENQCIRTQKKQKVFYWFSVKHDKLFLDALERDLKREAAGQIPCTSAKIPMSMPKAMELAKSQCMSLQGGPTLQTNAIKKAQVANQQARLENAQLQQQRQQQHYSQPAMLQYGAHQSNHMDLPPRPYSPAQHFQHVLHPGSPPQGLVTPPVIHQNIMGSPHFIDDGYRIQRTDSPMQSMMSNSPIGSSSSMTPQLHYVDPMQNNHNGYGLTLSSMFNPEYPNGQERMFPSRSHLSQSYNAKYTPYSTGRPDTSANGEKVFDCPQTNCPRQFKRQEHLRRHFRSHTGEKPYVCMIPECRRAFARSDHLQHHLRIHSNASEYDNDTIMRNLMHSPPLEFQLPKGSPALYNDFQRSDSRMSMHSAIDHQSYPENFLLPTERPASAPIHDHTPDEHSIQNAIRESAAAAMAQVQEPSTTSPVMFQSQDNRELNAQIESLTGALQVSSKEDC